MESLIQVTIEGIQPLLMHRFPIEGTPKGYEKWTAGDQAEFAAYRNPATSELQMQSEAIRQAMISAAKWSKGKGRASLKTEVAACVFVRPDWLGLGVTAFVIDSRSVVNPTTKGRIVHHRPRFDEWALAFTIAYDPLLLKADDLRVVLTDAGSRVGIGDFRVEKSGYFGRFRIVEWSPAG